MWPEPAEGTSAHDVPGDDTPETGSPVDIDRPIPEPAPLPRATPVVVTPPPKNKPPKPDGWWRRTLLGFPVWMLLAFAAVVVGVFLVVARSGDPGTNSADRVQSTQAPTTVPSQVLPATTVATPTTLVAATLPPPTAPPPVFTLPNAPDTVAATAPATVPPTAPATEPPAVAATVPPATAPPAVAPPEATLPADGPVVTIIGRVAPCDYGAQCLLAGFALHNFKTQPSEFVCEFADGSRFTFHFNRQEVERACATGNSNGSITIEVDGVRSATFTRP